MENIMKTELLDTNLSVAELETIAQDNQEAAFRTLAEAELLLIGGGGGDVIWG
jgi:hypothetical protein